MFGGHLCRYLAPRSAGVQVNVLSVTGVCLTGGQCGQVRRQVNACHRYLAIDNQALQTHGVFTMDVVQWKIQATMVS